MTAPPTRLYRRLLDDRWNPILVKEVRQALRGRFFRVAFVCTLVGVTVASLALITGMGETPSPSEGRSYFAGVFLFLLVAVMGLVPFQAFTAMGAEWEENTYDLLVLSHLRPRGIVTGKFLAALVQALLYFSAFTPFLVFAFLLQQVDLLAVGVLLLGSVGASLALTAVALCLSTLSRVRFARVVLMAALAGLLTLLIRVSVELAHELHRSPGVLRDPQTVPVLLALVLVGTAALAFSLVAAGNMLAHPEENRSTNVRILTSSLLVLALSWCTWLHTGGRALVGAPSREEVGFLGTTLLVVFSLPAVFLVTEPEALGRRVRRQVPRRRVLAAAAFPFLPGGARGASLWVLHAGLITLFVLVGQARAPVGPHGFLGDGIGAYLALLAFCWIHLLLPSAVFAPFTDAPQLRAAVRVLMPFLVLLFAFGPALVGFFLDDPALMRADHAGNVFHVLDELWNRPPSEARRYLPFLATVSVVTLVANVPRLVRAARETTTHSRHARAAVLQPTPTADAVAGS